MSQGGKVTPPANWEDRTSRTGRGENESGTNRTPAARVKGSKLTHLGAGPQPRLGCADRVGAGKCAPEPQRARTGSQGRSCSHLTTPCRPGNHTTISRSCGWFVLIPSSLPGPPWEPRIHRLRIVASSGTVSVKEKNPQPGFLRAPPPCLPRQIQETLTRTQRSPAGASHS